MDPGFGRRQGFVIQNWNFMVIDHLPLEKGEEALLKVMHCKRVSFLLRKLCIQHGNRMSDNVPE